MGSRHIGGSEIMLSGLELDTLPINGSGTSVQMDPNGAYEIGQMYVQYVLLAERPMAPPPVLFMHGGGMTGAMWESTPDGRPGWQGRLLEGGFDTYVADAVERGRAGWARYPEIFPGPPLHRSKKDVWEAFRIGPPDSYHGDPTRRAPYASNAFPMDAFDQFVRQCVPRWIHTDALALRAYLQCVEWIGPCLLIAHSQGCAFAFELALRAPHLVKAIVAVEPGGFPDESADLSAMASTPVKVFWGDNVTSHFFWGPARDRSIGWIDRLNIAGGRGHVIDLPSHGIAGSSHLPMGDLTSDAVARHVTSWLREVVR